jgi:hypothetical protein
MRHRRTDGPGADLRNRIALGGAMIYHPGREIHYGLKSRSNGRDAEPQDLPQIDFPGFGNLGVGEV